jgi:hypothetical protein
MSIYILIYIYIYIYICIYIYVVVVFHETYRKTLIGVVYYTCVDLVVKFNWDVKKYKTYRICDVDKIVMAKSILLRIH